MTRCSCGSDISIGHAVHRGVLINAIATLGSQIVQTREQIQSLRGKRWSKRFGEQHERDMKTLADLEAKLPELEGRFAGWRFLERELYGG